MKIKALFSDNEKNTVKGVQKLKNRSLKSLGIFWPYIIIPIHWITLKPLCFFLKTVIFDFFFLQFKVKLGWKKIRTVQVIAPMDNHIPFRPEYTDIYLDFINFWIRPLNFIILRFGRRRALPYLANFMSAIGRAYYEASRVYKICMSTTPRFPAGTNKNLKRIYRLDPHLLCVPSLHIAVVILTHCFFTDVFRREKMPQEEFNQYERELWLGALEIGETVLYVKQHSVNCIPAALYMMIHLLKGQFTIQKAVDYIDRLFIFSPDISPEQLKEIHNHIHYMFDRLLLEGCNEEDWRIPVLRWLSTQPKAG